MRELDTECGNEEEVGGSRDVVFAEDVEGTLDGKANKRRSPTNGKHVQNPPNHYKKEAVKVPWPCTQRTKPREGLFAWDGGRDKSERKAKNEIHGWTKNVAWVRKRWRGRPVGGGTRGLEEHCRPRH